jgi:enoyl-CoA hydratase
VATRWAAVWKSRWRATCALRRRANTASACPKSRSVCCLATAARALELGLVDRVFPADRLVDETVDYVARLAKGPTLAIGNIKIASRLGADLPLEGALALEREAVWRLFMSEDAAEGLAAFAEKRAPVWKGR